MSTWSKLTVAELESRGEASLQTGPFGTQLKASDYTEEGIPVINVRNIGFGDVRKADLEYLGESKAEALHQHHLKKGDIVFGRKGAVERHALIDNATHGWIQGSDCLRLRINSPAVSERYLSYYLKTQAHQDWMQALCAFGATMPSLNQDIVRRISFPAPARGTQEKIAAILSSYDELIENNRRRIALLEKMAEEIYREWFVRMRFPGWAEVPVKAGIPLGWSSKALSDLVGEQKKSVKRTELANFSRYVGLEHISRKSISLVDFADPMSVDSDKLAFKSGDILFSKIRPYLHKVALAHFDGVCSTDALVLRAKKDCYREFVLFTVFSDTFIDLANTASKGTKMPRADWHFLKQLKVCVPAEAVLDAFRKIVLPMLDEMAVLTSSNEQLSAAAKQLLPRLISGKLPVEVLDIQFPPSMQAA